MEQIKAKTADLTYKSQLQIYCQKRKIPIPRYDVLRLGGQYLCNLSVDDKEFVGNSEMTKKEAENSAALAAMEGLGLVDKETTLDADAS